MKGLYENNGGGKQRAYLQIKGIKEKDPVFEAYEKDWNGARFKKVEWQFGSITFGSFKWTDEFGKDRETEKYTIILINEDDEEIHVSSTWTSLGRSILNSLCGVPNGELGKVSISLYMSKNGYPSAWVTNNGKPTNWALSIDEQKELIDSETLKDGTVKKYYTKLEERLKKICMTLSPMSIERELGIDVDQPTNEAKTLPEDFSEMPF